MPSSEICESTPPETLSVSAKDPELPPMDGTFTVDQLYEWQCIKSPNYPCFKWSETACEETFMNWEEMGLGVDRAAEKIIKDIEGLSELYIDGRPDSPKRIEPIVVGILASTELITYSTFLIALQRLTHPTGDDLERQHRPLLPFPLSTRNSPTATAHLIQKANIQCVYVSEGPMMELLHQAIRESGKELAVASLRMPTFSELYGLSNISPIKARKISPPVDMDTPAVILHSSGSTAYPKPITLTHRTLLEWTNCLSYGGMKSKGEIWAVHAAPAFHAMGILGIMWAPAHRLIRAASPPNANLPPPTPEYYLSQIVESGATMVYCVPSFLEAWAEDEVSIQVLKKLKVLMYAGAPLSVKTGTLLRKRGVNLRCAVGATEYGQICIYPTEPFPEGYDWLEFSPITVPCLIPQAEDNVYELVFKEGPRHHLSVHNTHIDGVPAYASSDLIQLHPMNKKLWRIIGRADDQIMLSTGEKTNPGPLEQIIARNNHVKGAVLFGRGRLQNGVIVESASRNTSISDEVFRNLIWPSVEEANAFAPLHSRIFKEEKIQMILIASHRKPFTYTPKGTPRRGAIVKDYDPEIEALYTAVKDSSQIDILAPLPQDSLGTAGGWPVSDTIDFIRKVVGRVMRVKSLGDADDFFEAGCTSLEATYIRNAILRGLRESAPACQVHQLSTNFVYQHSSIAALGKYIAKISGDTGIVESSERAVSSKARTVEMDEMVEKYTKHFPTHASARAQATRGEVILLTGSTGGLGSQILAQLITLSSIRMIYAFNRPSKAGVSSLDRHCAAFLDRGNDPAVLTSDKIIFVEGDTSLDGLGLPVELLEQIRMSVTTIIHNAWQVDFKMILPSFEPAIRGVRNLVDLALQSPHQEPPRILFTSSIGILRNWIPHTIPEAPVVNPSLITSSGYGASKWVSERILLEAAAVTALKPVIIRVGQLAGGLNGCWNIQEWYPSLVRGSQILGYVPDNDGLVSWVPLHVAAAAAIELRNSPSPIAHLIHPRPVAWAIIAQHVARLLKLPLVSYQTWISKLQSAATNSIDVDLRNNPALRLLDFFAGSVTPGSGFESNNRETMGLAVLETKITRQWAPSLGENLVELQEGDVANWISYWRRKEFLEA